MRAEYIAGIVLTLLWVGVWFTKPGTLAVSPKEAPSTIIIIWIIIAITILFDAPMGSIKWFLIIVVTFSAIGLLMGVVKHHKIKSTQAKQAKQQDKDKEQDKTGIGKEE